MFCFPSWRLSVNRRALNKATHWYQIALDLLSLIPDHILPDEIISFFESNMTCVFFKALNKATHWYQIALIIILCHLLSLISDHILSYLT